MKHLKLEAAFSIEDANKLSLGLNVNKTSNMNPQLLAFQLYDTNQLYNNAKRYYDDIVAHTNYINNAQLVNYIKRFSESSTYAWLEIDASPDAPQYGASTVGTAAAKKGYGPLIYDMVLSSVNGLVPDRISVSPKAQKVWQHYFEKRKDVDHKLLDDPDDPWTPEKEDDTSRMHPGRENNPLNYAYSKHTSMNLHPFLTANSELVKKLLELFKSLSEDKIKNAITDGGKEFFYNRMLENG